MSIKLLRFDNEQNMKKINNQRTNQNIESICYFKRNKIFFSMVLDFLIKVISSKFIHDFVIGIEKLISVAILLFDTNF